MKKIRLLYYLSVLLLIAGGVLFVRLNRYGSAIRVIENFGGKTMVFYSSTFKREYLNSSGGSIRDMDKLCAEGSDELRKAGLDSLSMKIADGTSDPYTLSEKYLNENLKKGSKYILIDLSRAQTEYGSRYKCGGEMYCPITITISKKSLSYDESLIFAGRIKYILDNKCKDLPVRIVESTSGDYNQSKGYIGMLVEIGDSANTFGDAEKSLRIFCDAIKEVAAAAN
jgi:stage II sporulation protein P